MALKLRSKSTSQLLEVLDANGQAHTLLNCRSCWGRKLRRGGLTIATRNFSLRAEAMP